MPFCLQRTMLHLATNIIIYRKPTYLLRVKTPGALRQKHRISGVLQGSANGSASGGPEAPRFGQLRGHSVFNTPPLVTLCLRSILAPHHLPRNLHTLPQPSVAEERAKAR